jgi:SpoVK/Ycf46/Vps4 family AAA+-type ATPase
LNVETGGSTMRRLRRRKTPKTKYEEALKELKRIFLSDGLPEDPVVDIHQYFKLSQQALGEYVTLDWIHKREIDSLIKMIQEYLEDFSKTRPLNIIMIAQPGLGKSHFVKCLAKKCQTWESLKYLLTWQPCKMLKTFLSPSRLFEI